MPSLPSLIVEIGRSGWLLGTVGSSELGTTTYLGYATWDDITSKVLSASIRRGRQHELDRIETGTAALTLLNQDGAFNPTNTSSAYWPDVRPMVPLRIQAIFPDPPGLISGLIGWYDFSDTTTLFTDTARTTPVASDGDIIKGVTDKSGTAHHLSEATNGPTYKVNIVNGQSVGRFDGTNDQLTATITALGIGDYLVIMAVKMSNVTGHRLLGGSTTSGTNEWLLSSDNMNDLYGGTSHNLGTTALGTTNWHVAAYHNASGTCTGYVDGVAGSTPVADAQNRTGTTLGISGPTANSFLAGDIAEYIIYDATISNSDRRIVEAYLGEKYNIAVT